jgi:hypothetical protein
MQARYAGHAYALCLCPGVTVDATRYGSIRALVIRVVLQQFRFAEANYLRG